MPADDLSDLEIAVLCDLLEGPGANLKAHKRAVLDHLVAVESVFCLSALCPKPRGRLAISERPVTPRPLDRPGIIGRAASASLAGISRYVAPAEGSKDARLGALTMHSGICCQEYRAIPYEI